MSDTIFVGNGCGFWGDSTHAPKRLLQTARLNYLTLDYLAEVSMSILARQRAKNPQMGYPRDLLRVGRQIAWWLGRGLKLVTNGGGLTPRNAAEALARVLRAAGEEGIKIAVLTGDDLMPHIDGLLANGHWLEHIDTGASIEQVRAGLVAANAYLGAAPMVDALTQGADIVLTGRVADPSMTLACAMHAFGWEPDDWDKIAAGTIAGHVIECGAQATGGLYSRWEQVDGWDNIGYPIAEVSDDGSVVITKPTKSGGMVAVDTVAEQLLYEVGDPGEFKTPDVTVDLTCAELQPDGENRVRVAGVKGSPPSRYYKVSACYSDGWMAEGRLTFFGPNAPRKARATGDIILKRLEGRGMKPERTCVEAIGAGACRGRIEEDESVTEVTLRVAVSDPDRHKLVEFVREVAPLVTNGPPGATGYFGGRARPREVFAFWPCLIEKNAVSTHIQWIET